MFWNKSKKLPQEELIEIKDIPQSSVGAPCPLIYATEFDLFVTYFLNDFDPEWNGTSVKVVGVNTQDESSIIVRFKHVLAHYFGMPNDEAITGHPLAEVGLEPYSYYLVKNSSWLEKHEKMNQVHPYHKKEHYQDYKHFIFTFHDTTLEVISKEYSFNVTNRSLIANIEKIIKENA